MPEFKMGNNFCDTCSVNTRLETVPPMYMSEYIQDAVRLGQAGEEIFDTELHNEYGRRLSGNVEFVAQACAARIVAGECELYKVKE